MSIFKKINRIHEYEISLKSHGMMASFMIIFIGISYVIFVEEYYKKYQASKSNALHLKQTLETMRSLLHRQQIETEAALKVKEHLKEVLFNKQHHHDAAYVMDTLLQKAWLFHTVVESAKINPLSTKDACSETKHFLIIKGSYVNVRTFLKNNAYSLRFLHSLEIATLPLDFASQDLLTLSVKFFTYPYCSYYD